MLSMHTSIAQTHHTLTHLLRQCKILLIRGMGAQQRCCCMYVAPVWGRHQTYLDINLLSTSISEPSVLHVFSEVPSRNLQFCMFFWRFHARSSCFFGGSMSEPPFLHVCFFRGSMSKLPVLNVILEVPWQIHFVVLIHCKLVGAAWYGKDANFFCVFQNCLFCWTFSCRHYIYIVCRHEWFPHDVAVTFAIGRNIHTIGRQPCFS